MERVVLSLQPWPRRVPDNKSHARCGQCSGGHPNPENPVAMALTCKAVSLSSSSTLIDGKVPRQQAASTQCITIPTLPPPPVYVPRGRSETGWTAAAYCRRIARNLMTMARGNAPVMATAETSAISTSVAPAELSTVLPEIIQTIQREWDKIEDKYAVSSLAAAGVVALWGSAGVISAIDKLPLVPGVLEVVGIGYTGWFAYCNLVFKQDREAFIQKVKDTYNDIIGTS